MTKLNFRSEIDFTKQRVRFNAYSLMGVNIAF